jgi:hypothetical protein
MDVVDDACRSGRSARCARRVARHRCSSRRVAGGEVDSELIAHDDRDLDDAEEQQTDEREAQRELDRRLARVAAWSRPVRSCR